MTNAPATVAAGAGAVIIVQRFWSRILRLKLATGMGFDP
jgi:hypothetical protein